MPAFLRPAVRRGHVAAAREEVCRSEPAYTLVVLLEPIAEPGLGRPGDDATAKMTAKKEQIRAVAHHHLEATKVGRGGIALHDGVAIVEPNVIVILPNVILAKRDPNACTGLQELERRVRLQPGELEAREDDCLVGDPTIALHLSERCEATLLGDELQEHAGALVGSRTIA